MTRPLDLLLNEQWFSVLDQLGEAVIVIDDRRMLCHVNDAARRLLGYDPGQAVGGRCRHTTQGVDCEHACPLTFALEAGLQRVESFATVYRTASGEAVALDVTVVPLHDEERRFRGAVEILRPTSPKPGFFMSGHSEAAADLRRRALAAARVGGDLAIVGEGPVCRDLARAIHRFSGLPETLFHHWNGSWDGIAPWPPGAVFVDDVDLVPLLEEARPEGWRAMLGVRSIDAVPSGVEVFEQPPLDRHTADLPRMIATWVDELSPGTRVSAAALDVLVTLASDRGLAQLEDVLAVAVAAADGCVDTVHLPVDGTRPMFVDELLRAEKPLAALEERVLREVVELCGWRMQEAADRLGISRVTLWRKMKDLGIEKNA